MNRLAQSSPRGQNRQQSEKWQSTTHRLIRVYTHQRCPLPISVSGIQVDFRIFRNHRPLGYHRLVSRSIQKCWQKELATRQEARPPAAPPPAPPSVRSHGERDYRGHFCANWKMREQGAPCRHCWRLQDRVGQRGPRPSPGGGGVRGAPSGGPCIPGQSHNGQSVGRQCGRGIPALKGRMAASGENKTKT